MGHTCRETQGKERELGGGMQDAHIKSRIPGQKELTQSHGSSQVIKNPALGGKKPGTSIDTKPTVCYIAGETPSSSNDA